MPIPGFVAEYSLNTIHDKFNGIDSDRVYEAMVSPSSIDRLCMSQCITACLASFGQQCAEICEKLCPGIPEPI
jgi:hypothetical protein